jgi:acetyl-CoA acetyltransferase
MSTEAYGAGNGKTVARELYRQADVGPGDIDVAQIYDHFTPFVLMTLENYGFCKPGEMADFLEKGGIRWPDGRLPINTSGGNLSEGYIHGLNLSARCEGRPRLRSSKRNSVLLRVRSVAG